MATAEQGILLETGTNEVEIIEFYLGKQSFGTNVAKVKQIVLFEQELLTKIPETHEAVLGTFLFRDTPIPLIDLNKALQRPEKDKSARPLVLVTEFNRVTNGFLIDGVNRIHRITWDKLQPMNPLFTNKASSLTGSVSIEEREILIIDLEDVLSEINPEASFTEATASIEHVIEEDKIHLTDMNIIFAEDSTFIRESILNRLTSFGFKHVKAFEDGKKAHDYLQGLSKEIESSGKPLNNFLNIVVTDIEMPQMDGLTLCKKIKEHPVLSDIPVVIFSSLINKEMARKCDSVGATAYTSKPKLLDLVELIQKNALI